MPAACCGMVGKVGERHPSPAASKLAGPTAAASCRQSTARSALPRSPISSRSTNRHTLVTTTGSLPPFHLAHDDSSWLRGRIDYDPNSDIVTVWRGGTLRAQWDRKTKQYTRPDVQGWKDKAPQEYRPPPFSVRLREDSRPGCLGAWPSRLRSEWNAPDPRLSSGAQNRRDTRSPTQPGRPCSVICA